MLDRIFPCLARRDQIRILIRQVESSACALDGRVTSLPRQDSLRRLESTLRILNRLRTETGTPLPVAEPEGGGTEPGPVAEIETQAELSPVVRSLIELRDFVLVAGDQDRAKAAQCLQAVRDDLRQILELLGVSTLEGTGAYDEARQRIVDTLPTSDDSLDQTVEATLRPGYELGDRLIRPQEVRIRVFD